LRTIVKGRNIDVADVVRAYAERKVARLERLLDDRTDAIVELSVEQRRSVDDSHIAEITLVIDGQPLRCRAAGATYQSAIDVVTDKAERQAVDFKEKPRVRARPVEEKQLLSRLADGTGEGRREPRIVKVKRFDMEPMFEEDAVAMMADLGHSFFVFVNAENGRLNVLYRRLDGDYGLIEPVVGNGHSPTRERSQHPRATAGAQER
jgi:putative sigma-54 modulation protein